MRWVMPVDARYSISGVKAQCARSQTPRAGRSARRAPGAERAPQKNHRKEPKNGSNHMSKGNMRVWEEMYKIRPSAIQNQARRRAMVVEDSTAPAGGEGSRRRCRRMEVLRARTCCAREGGGVRW